MTYFGLTVTHPNHIPNLQSVEVLGSKDPTIFRKHGKTNELGIKGSKDPPICQELFFGITITKMI